MHRVTEDLVQSDIMKDVLKEGDKAPTFSLPDHGGNLVNSFELLKKGPLVVSFYRGVW
jgi:peroxiredoxin